MSGLFISLEGIEGSGKTTQNQMLATDLQRQGYDVLQTREPGGTPLGAQLRALILDPNQHFAHPMSEVLLFYADRFEHVEKVIKPALAAGKIVLCDRYIDSTYAYQIGGRNMPEDLIETLNARVDVLPDITILFDISEEVGIARATKRAALDRFEQEEVSFHRRVRQAYLKRATAFPDRIQIIEVQDLTPDEIFAQVQIRIKEKVS